MLKAYRRHIVQVLIILIAGFFAYRTRAIWAEIAAVLALSVFFALVLTPLSGRLERKGMSRSAAALSSIFILLFVLIVFLMVFVPYILSHSFALAKRIMPTIAELIDRGYAVLSQFGYLGEYQFDLPQILSSAVATLTTGIAKGGAVLASATGTLAMSLVISYYLLTIRTEAGLNLLLCIPTRYRNAFLCALSSCKNAVLSYLSGLMKTCAFVAGATFSGLILLGIRDAFILALFMGLLEIIPYIGPIFGIIPILLSVLPLGLIKTLLAVFLVFLIQQIESGVIGPYFTASSTSIHPLAAILGVFVGGNLFGLLGIVFAVPVIVVARSVLWSMRNASIHSDS